MKRICKIQSMGARKTFLSIAVLAAISPAVHADEINTVVVTAQKRPQLINDVGMAVTAIDSATLASQKITSLSDIANAVPGLDFTISSNNTPVLSLRGIGFYDSSLSAYPAVSVYLDEVPLSLPVLSTHTAFDLQRIEVMKGPQGTLFGQNSTGGALNFIAAKPRNAFAAAGDLSYGRFNKVEANGFVTGPVGAAANARLALHVVQGGDWQRSYMRNDTVGAPDVLAGRMIVDFNPAAWAKVSLNVNGWVDKSDSQAAQYIAAFPQQACCARKDVLAFPVAPNDPRAADWSVNARPKANNRLFQTAVRGDVDLTDALTLTSLTSYIEFDLDQVPEGDGSTFNILDVTSHTGGIKSFTQELRLANSDNGALHWVAGVNYDSTNARETFINSYPDSSTTPVLGIYEGGASGTQHMNNYAVFGSAEYVVAPAVTLKAGLRYTKSQRKSENCGFDPGGGAINGLFTYLSGLLSGASVPALQSGDCFNMDNNFRNGPPFFGELNEHNVSSRIGIDYKPSKQTLLYANVAKGYKAGSFPVLAGATNLQYAPVTQESVLSYEVGAKTSVEKWLDMNATAFYYDYKDKQLKSKMIDPVFGVLDALVNVPRTKLKGVELELVATPWRGVTVAGAVSYVDASITRYTGINNAGVLADFAGAKVPYTPKWNARLNADYKWLLGGQLAAFVGSSITGKSGTVSIVGGEFAVIDGKQDLYRLNSHTLVDVRAGIASLDEKWRLSVFGQNIGNKFYAVNASTDSDAIVRYAGRPAVWGITLGWRY